MQGGQGTVGGCTYPSTNIWPPVMHMVLSGASLTCKVSAFDLALCMLIARYTVSMAISIAESRQSGVLRLLEPASGSSSAPVLSRSRAL